jgi:hypothetical protein
VGSNPLNESSAFKKIKMFSKSSPSDLISSFHNFNLKYDRLFFFFENETNYTNSVNFGIQRQHNFLNGSAITNGLNTFFDFNSFKK